MKRRLTAHYEMIADNEGNRYQFFCDLSGALGCTTNPFRGDTPEKELLLAWEKEGRAEFNHWPSTKAAMAGSSATFSSMGISS